MTKPFTAADLLAADWDEVPQDGIGKQPVADCAMKLAPFQKGGSPRLWLTLSTRVAADLGWTIGMRLALRVGAGHADGWLRFERDDTGRPLRKLGKHGRIVFALFDPGADLGRFEADRQPAEYHLARQGKAPAALLVRIPWSFEEAAPAAAAA
jgi:hypothetical protein